MLNVIIKLIVQARQFYNKKLKISSESDNFATHCMYKSQNIPFFSKRNMWKKKNRLFKMRFLSDFTSSSLAVILNSKSVDLNSLLFF